jgi:hypothetical protein
MDGAVKVYPLGELTTFEDDLLKEAIVELRHNIERGVNFFNQAGNCPGHD